MLAAGYSCRASRTCPDYTSKVRAGRLRLVWNYASALPGHRRKRAMKFGVDDSLYELLCCASNGPDLLTRHVLVSIQVISYSCSLLCKLDMEQHCEWIVHGTVGLRGKGCTRMRPKLHLPVPVRGHALRASGSGDTCGMFVIWKATSRLCTWYEPAARKGVECRLGGSIIKIASRKNVTVVTHRSIREQLDTNPAPIPRRQPKLPCDSHGLRLPSRPSNIPDLPVT